jgi:hypothetical protein
VKRSETAPLTPVTAASRIGQPSVATTSSKARIALSDKHNEVPPPWIFGIASRTLRALAGTLAGLAM